MRCSHGVHPDSHAGRELEGTRFEQSFILAAALITHFNWFALIVFHGVLVPNSLARGAGVAGATCARVVSGSRLGATGGRSGALYSRGR
mgnify:CR=1 FL=1